MKNNEKCKLGFILLSESWYGKACLTNAPYIDQVMIGLYSHEGNPIEEFVIRWVNTLGKFTPRLESFSDSWCALYEFREVLAKLSGLDMEEISPKYVCVLLRECGIEDMTQHDAPGPLEKAIIDDR